VEASGLHRPPVLQRCEYLLSICYRYIVLSVCLSTAVSCADMTDRIEMLFGAWTRVGPKIHVLGWASDLSRALSLW